MNELVIKLKGEVVDSSFMAFKTDALAFVDKWSKKLETPEDFAGAKKAVKQLKEAEQAIDIAMDKALDSTRDIKDLLDDLKDLRGTLRDCRLPLNKSVVDEEARVRDAAVVGATEKLNSYVKELAVDGVPATTLRYSKDAITKAAKGKRTEKTLNNAVDKAVEAEKLFLANVATYVKRNVLYLDNMCKMYPGLFFPDRADLLVTEDEQMMIRLVESRVQIHLDSMASAEAAAKIKAETEAKEQAEADLAAEEGPEQGGYVAGKEYVPVSQSSAATTEQTGTTQPGHYAINIHLECKKKRAIEILGEFNTKFGQYPEVTKLYLGRN